MIEVISFLFFKLLGAVLLLIWWAWPPLVALLAWECNDDCIEDKTVKKIWRGVIIVLFVLGAPTYWGAIYPDSEPTVSKLHAHPSDGLFYFVFRGFDAQVKRNDLANPPEPVRTELGVELRRYRLDGWNPPKHFYVALTDLSTGAKHDSIYVSKHCNSSGSLRRGDEYNITLRKYSLSTRPGEVFYEFTNLYGVFC